MRSKMLDYVFETGIYDAFELIGGQTVHENNLQIAYYMDQLQKAGKSPLSARLTRTAPTLPDISDKVKR